MCLQKITKRYEPPDPRVRQAYKIMEKNGYTPFYQVQYTEAWLQATEHSIYVGSPEGDYYLSGFHVFPTRKAARQALSLLTYIGGKISQGKHTIRKVEIRDVTYEGTDGTSSRLIFQVANIPNLVARWIRLIPGKV